MDLVSLGIFPIVGWALAIIAGQIWKPNSRRMANILSTLATLSLTCGFTAHFVSMYWERGQTDTNPIFGVGIFMLLVSIAAVTFFFNISKGAKEDKDKELAATPNQDTRDAAKQIIEIVNDWYSPCEIKIRNNGNRYILCKRVIPFLPYPMETVLVLRFFGKKQIDYIAMGEMAKNLVDREKSKWEPRVYFHSN